MCSVYPTRNSLPRQRSVARRYVSTLDATYRTHPDAPGRVFLAPLCRIRDGLATNYGSEDRRSREYRVFRPPLSPLEVRVYRGGRPNPLHVASCPVRPLETTSAGRASCL